MRNPLVPQTDAEYRHDGMEDHIARDAEIPVEVRPPGTRRNNNAVEIEAWI